MYIEVGHKAKAGTIKFRQWYHILTINKFLNFLIKDSKMFSKLLSISST